LRDFALLLKENGVHYSAKGSDYLPVNKDQSVPLLRIEITQLFTNMRCAITSFNKQWQAMPFQRGELGVIEVSAPNIRQAVFTAVAPWSSADEGDTSRPTAEQVRSVIAQDDGSVHFKCEDSANYIEVILGHKAQSEINTEWLFNVTQVVALDVHRVFGSVVAKRN
jgi:hypothetical protein